MNATCDFTFGFPKEIVLVDNDLNSHTNVYVHTMPMSRKRRSQGFSFFDGRGHGQSVSTFRDTCVVDMSCFLI